MKYVFKKIIINLIFITLISKNCFARDLFLITGQRESVEMIKTVKRLIRDNFNIPDSMIQTRVQENPCIPNKQVIMHFCYQEGLKTIFLNQLAIERAFAQWQWDIKE